MGASVLEEDLLAGKKIVIFLMLAASVHVGRDDLSEELECFRE